MTEIQFVPMEVTLIDIAGNDGSIADAARVSLDTEVDRSRDAGLINTLLRKKHGSPFEHTFMKMHVKAPIFVFREFMRHRIGFSYNEMSGRYMQLPAEFYIPPMHRPLINSGTSMNPVFIEGDIQQRGRVADVLAETYRFSYEAYEHLLEFGIANEVARAVLPVGIMSQMVVTCNVRSMLNFLMLRVDDPINKFPTKPQWEINQVALKMEAIFALYYPMTYAAFIGNGRVAP